MDAGCKLQELLKKYDVDSMNDSIISQMLAEAKRENISEHDLRLALDFIRMARQREEDEMENDS